MIYIAISSALLLLIIIFELFYLALLGDLYRVIRAAPIAFMIARTNFGFAS